MLQMPHRSVTRFFIPLIDVLTLLFCVFLIMPAAEPGVPYSEGEPAPRPPARDTGATLTEKLKAELDQLRKEKMKALQQLVKPQILDIDPNTGQLYSFQGGDLPQRIEIANRTDVINMVNRHRRERNFDQREPYYVIRYPRERNTGFPTVAQRKAYEDWFQGVAALAFDNPNDTLEGGR
jgi:hypothetical protein